MRKVLGFILSFAMMLQPLGLAAKSSEDEYTPDQEIQDQEFQDQEDDPDLMLPEGEPDILFPDDLDPDFLYDPQDEQGYGWNGNVFYSLADGQPLTGWLLWNEDLYYFDENGMAASCELEIEGQRYRFDEQGRLMRGYVYDSAAQTHQYYSLLDGTQQSGIHFYDEHLYVLNDDIAAGPQNIAGQDVYVLEGGELLTDAPMSINGNLYYYLSDGSRAVDYEREIDGNRYTFGSDGIGHVIELNDNEKAANAIIEQIGTDLYSAFSWVVDTLSYRKDVFDRTMDEYAQIGFQEQQGNCFTYASCFYYLAKQLGYAARYVHGLVKFYTGQVSEHGWVMIQEGDKEWIYDPEAEDEIGKGVYHFYKVDPLDPIIGYRFPEGEEPLGGYTQLY